MKAETHPYESRRLDALHRYQVLDTPKESDYDEVVQLLSALCDAPVAVLNFVDAERQWFKAEVGLGVSETPLDVSICAHVILQNDFVEITDTLNDPRLVDNPLCTGDVGFRFYAGALLMSEDGMPLGTLCILDYVPRTLTPIQRRTIQVLANQVMKQLELRRALAYQDLLRREINHRVTNSLSTVAAVVHMQRLEADDPVLHDTLNAIEQRIHGVAHLHRELCESETMESVDMHRFMSRIGTQLRKLAPPNVTIDIKVESMMMDARQAACVGIMVNEFIINSLKHAFPDQRTGRISIVCRMEDPDTCLLHCQDNGIGRNATPADAQGSGLGTRIIEASIMQLGASSRTQTIGEGCVLDLRFPVGPIQPMAQVVGAAGRR